MNEVLIFAGIIRCDMIAEAIIGAADVLGPLKVPLVIRLEGTNSEAGLKLVRDLNFEHSHFSRQANSLSRSLNQALGSIQRADLAKQLREQSN